MKREYSYNPFRVNIVAHLTPRSTNPISRELSVSFVVYIHIYYWETINPSSYNLGFPRSCDYFFSRKWGDLWIIKPLPNVLDPFPLVTVIEFWKELYVYANSQQYSTEHCYWINWHLQKNCLWTYIIYGFMDTRLCKIPLLEKKIKHS